MRRVNVGDIEIVSLLDGTETYPASQVYLDAGDALAQYSDYLDPDDCLLLPFSSFLLRDGDLTVLVDTGNGPEVQGRLLEELREVDTSGAAQFPNARYLVPRGDWDHYRAAVPPSVSFTRDVAALEGLGVLELIDDGHVLSPSLAALHTPGHTPGHMTIVVESGGAQAYVLGDAFLTPIDVAQPDWVTTWDWSAPEVRRTRSRRRPNASSTCPPRTSRSATRDCASTSSGEAAAAARAWTRSRPAVRWSKATWARPSSASTSFGFAARALS